MQSLCCVNGCSRFYPGKSKVSPNRIERPRGQGVRDIALHSLDLGARRGLVVSTKPRPLYPRERPGTNCTGGWVGPNAGLDVCENLTPTGIRSPDLPARIQSLYRLSYPGPASPQRVDIYSPTYTASNSVNFHLNPCCNENF
jgi:hypothetical protein